MSAVDMRRPAEVTAAFRARLTELLVPKGFVARAKGARFVRKRGPNRHEISLGSSHYNSAGNVTCFVAYSFFDAACEAAVNGWRAGGPFEGPAFFDRGPNNVAEPQHAQDLIDRMLTRLAFFDFLEQPGEAARAIRERYVPGFYEPQLIVPYLRVHLGADAVRSYARALLTARPELWPAFLSASQQGRPASTLRADHGTALAIAMAADEALDASEAPDDMILSSSPQANNLRAHYGLMLRAWGEPVAAGLLRRCSDDAVQKLRAEVEALPDKTVDSIDAARLGLRLALGEAREPSRGKPTPRHFQYHVAHGPFEPQP